MHGSVFNTARNSGIGVARAREYYPAAPPGAQRVWRVAGGRSGCPRYNGRNRRSSSSHMRAIACGRLRPGRSACPPADDAGDFSGPIDGQGRKYTPRSLTSAANWRLPFNNQIPTTRESPLAKYQRHPAAHRSSQSAGIVQLVWSRLQQHQSDHHHDACRSPVGPRPALLPLLAQSFLPLVHDVVKRRSDDIDYRPTRLPSGQNDSGVAS